MRSLPEEARAKVEINELRVARGIVDYSSVRLDIDGRKPEEMPSILAELERLPPHVEDKLIHLEDADGRLWLLPEENLDLAQQSLEEIPSAAIPPAVVVAQEYAEHLVRAHERGFDTYPAAVRATWLIETIKRVNKVGAALEGLGHYLAFAAPDKHNAKQPLQEADRDVHAAILKDVYKMKPEKIREKLGMKPLSKKRRPGSKLSPSERAEDHRDDATVRTIADRGREVLERDFGKEGWRAKAEKMRAMWEGFNELEKQNR